MSVGYEDEPDKSKEDSMKIFFYCFCGGVVLVILVIAEALFRFF